MKKLILIFALFLSLSACGYKETKQSPTDNTRPDEYVEDLEVTEENTETVEPETHEPVFVNVKYCNEPVDIALFEELDTSKSSWIGGAWYDAENEYMIIKLNGVYYQYCSLPQSVWNDFKDANSFGSEYNASIKGKFICE